MTSIVKRGTAIGVVALLALAGSVGATARTVGATHNTAAAASSNVDWPMFGNNTDDNRFANLTQINTSNVSKLGVAWTMPEGANQATWETDPIVVNGTMYLTTNADQVLAVNAATGKLLWEYTPKVNFYLAVAGGGGGVPTNRGVTVANGRVYLLTFDDQLISLQQATGEKIWDTRVADPNMGYAESSPPTYWDGLLFVGSAVSDSGLRGFVAAYNASTGKQVWRYYTVPAPGHGWNPAQGGHGGGDVWMPQTIDTKTGILYFGTGNPSPDEVNTNRPGCDPWVDSTVALNAHTGKFLWAHTQVCPDLWDYDSHQNPMLFSVTQNGKTVRAVGQGNKEGHYWIFNAANGKVLAESPALAKETLPRPKPNPQGVTVCPGAAGGIEYSPAAYSPMAHAVYQPSLDICMIFKTIPPAQVRAHKTGQIDFGGSITPAKLPQAGYMSAVDVNTGKLLWHTKVSGPMIGGAVATAGNLTFAGSDNGHFYAFDTRNGKILWDANLGLSFGAAPIAYEVNGTEYIAIAAGGSSAIAALDGGAIGGTLVVFKLNGGPIKKLPAVKSGAVPTKSELPDLKTLTKVNPYMYVDTKRQRLVLLVTAAKTSNNNGFNFDGYAKGQATFVIPQGWNVTMEFTNKAALPHSAAITSNLAAPPKVPLFGIAPVETPNPVVGTAAGITQLVGFAPLAAGNYYLACLVPGHIQSGMWDRLTVSSTAKMPAIQTK